MLDLGFALAHRVADGLGAMGPLGPQTDLLGKRAPANIIQITSVLHPPTLGREVGLRQHFGSGVSKPVSRGSSTTTQPPYSRPAGPTIAPVNFYDIIETTGKVIDGTGVAVTAVGALVAAAAVAIPGRRNARDAYEQFREGLGRAILLGLEFLVAADIIRTVAITPDARSVAVLGGIVLIRTFLSFSLELEVTGRWPWQKPDQRATVPDPGTPPARTSPATAQSSATADSAAGYTVLDYRTSDEGPR